MNDKDLFKLCKEYFKYNPLTGIITWSKKSAKKTIVGDEAGTPHSNGYRSIIIKGKSYLSHRVAFLMTWEYLPEYIDHINGIKNDNWIDNLRDATRANNQHNRGIQNNNKSGYKGVSWNTLNKKWRAQIRISTRRLFLGEFKCKDEAANAWNKAALKHHGEFAYQNIIKERVG